MTWLSRPQFFEVVPFVLVTRDPAFGRSSWSHWAECMKQLSKRSLRNLNEPMPAGPDAPSLKCVICRKIAHYAFRHALIRSGVLEVQRTRSVIWCPSSDVCRFRGGELGIMIREPGRFHGVGGNARPRADKHADPAKACGLGLRMGMFGGSAQGRSLRGI